MTYPYTLEKGSGPGKLHWCPDCGEKTFKRYVHVDTGEYLHESVGRCNREVKCRRHYKPRDYFQDNGYPAKKNAFRPSRSSPPSPARVYIPFDILKQTRGEYESNSFVRHLLTLFDCGTVSRLIAEYHLGTSNDVWPGACVFWFIDRHKRIHAGQVKLFDSTGHTAKRYFKGEKKKCTTWIHAILRKKLNSNSSPYGEPTLPEWLSRYISQDMKSACLFGEHLITESTKPIAIVEAPATAIVASMYLPQFTWMACGALSWLTEKRCEALKDRRVTLFPDLNGYERWKAIGDKLGFGCSDLLERIATAKEKAAGLDLRDYLERFPVASFAPITT